MPPGAPVPRYLLDVVRAHARAAARATQAAAARDRAIRQASDEGVTPQALQEATGLSRQRVLQIRRGTR